MLEALYLRVFQVVRRRERPSPSSWSVTHQLSSLMSLLQVLTLLLLSSSLDISNSWPKSKVRQSSWRSISLTLTYTSSSIDLFSWSKADSFIKVMLLLLPTISLKILVWRLDNLWTQLITSCQWFTTKAKKIETGIPNISRLIKKSSPLKSTKCLKMREMILLKKEKLLFPSAPLLECL